MIRLEASEVAVPERLTWRSIWRRGDRALLLTVGGLAAFGLVMVFSASETQGWLQHGNAAYYFQRQLVWLLIGLALLVAAAHLDYHRLRGLARPVALVTVVLLILVLLPHVGLERNGARRWLQLGPIGMQPAELAKLALLLFMAAWLERRRDRLGSIQDGVAPFLAILAIAVMLIILERDLGTTLIVSVILLAQFLVAGARKRHALLLLAVVALSVAFFIRLEPYRLHRILAFLNPWADPLNTGFQSIQSVLALGSGGLFGVGLGQSIQKYQWLPFAHTDFIFAIIGEETGLVGTAAVLGAFGLLTYRGYRIALRAPDLFGTLVACGITSWLAFQAMINIGAVTITLPTTGIPLPLVSYGGSSLAISLLAIGILMNIAIQGEKVGWVQDASVDLGRRHRRPPVSGDRRRAGAFAKGS